ncbi:hypothetical protein VTN02DRAFT_146 [Thermoascus thermophilus]
MESRNEHRSLSGQLDKVTDRLALYQQQLDPSSTSPVRSDPSPTSSTTPASTTRPTTAMARDPITCHVLNTLTGTPAANLPVTLTLLSSSSSTCSSSSSSTGQDPIAFHATTNSDGRVSTWTPLSQTTATTVPAVLSALPTADTKTHWSLRFEVGPWYEAQGVESFWPEVEVRFTVRGRGREGEEGWRHYHVPVLLGPWNYSTYRGS